MGMALNPATYLASLLGTGGAFTHSITVGFGYGMVFVLVFLLLSLAIDDGIFPVGSSGIPSFVSSQISLLPF